MTGISPPLLLEKVNPVYSEEARNALVEGRVDLYIEVGLDGRAHNLKIRRALGLGLDERAIEAVRQWRFKPATKNGEPIQVGANVSVIFQLIDRPVLPGAPPRASPLPAVSPVHSSLSVISTPPGASIEINGKFAGITPSLLKVDPGAYKIVLRRAGFRDWEQQVQAGTGASVGVDAQMEKFESPNVIVIHPEKRP